MDLQADVLHHNIRNNSANSDQDLVGEQYEEVKECACPSINSPFRAFTTRRNDVVMLFQRKYLQDMLVLAATASGDTSR